MAVTTRINDYPVWHWGEPVPDRKPNATVFGYPIPKNIHAVDHAFNVATGDVTIGWTTEMLSPQERKWHQMEISMPITEEKILALLVAMKLTC